MSDPSHERACRIADKYRTARYRELERLEAYVKGTQYAGRPDFLSPGGDVPLLQRAPNVVAPLAKNGIRSNCNFVLGEGRWPQILAAVSEAAGASELSPEDGETLNRYIDKISTHARLRAVMRQMLAAAQGARSAAAVCGIRKGRLEVSLVPAKCCEPVLDPTDPHHVLAIEIRYPYVEQFRTPDGLAWRCRLYRRVIDATRDVTYLPGDGNDEGTEPTWVEDAARTFEHGFGFCPVVWYPFLRQAETTMSIDGIAIHEDLTDEIDAYNFSVSQRHRAALYCGDPQIVEIGVSSDDGPKADGAAAVMVPPGGKGPGYFGLTSRGAPARRKGPGNVWRYEDSAAKVDILTLPADALGAIDSHARDLRATIHEGMAVVDLDVENAKVAENATGKAQEIAYRRQLDNCDVIREDFGDAALLPVVDMLLRISLWAFRNRTKVTLWIGGLTEVGPILERFERNVGGGTTTWLGPRLDLAWGPYFRPNALDAKQDVEATDLALKAGVITFKIAVEKMRPHFPMHADDNVLVAVSPEQLAAISALQIGSPTLDRILRTRAALTAAPCIEDNDAKAIENEVAENVDAQVDMKDALLEQLRSGGGGGGEENDEDAPKPKGKAPPFADISEDDEVDEAAE